MESMVRLIARPSLKRKTQFYPFSIKRSRKPTDSFERDPLDIYVEKAIFDCCKFDYASFRSTETELQQYFVRIITHSGCSGFYNVVSKAWQLVCVSFHAAEQQKLDSLDCLPSHLLVTDSFMKAVVIASVSLAVDVAADFEAPFIVPAFCWSHFFVNELCPGVAGQSMSSDGIALMKAKMWISSCIDWNLYICSPADAFTVMADRLLKGHSEMGKYCSGCSAVETEKPLFIRFLEPILLSASFVLLPHGVGAHTVGALSLVVAYTAFQIIPICESSVDLPRWIRRVFELGASCTASVGVDPCIRNTLLQSGHLSVLNEIGDIQARCELIGEIEKASVACTSMLGKTPKALPDVQDLYLDLTQVEDESETGH